MLDSRILTDLQGFRSAIGNSFLVFRFYEKARMVVKSDGDTDNIVDLLVGYFELIKKSKGNYWQLFLKKNEYVDSLIHSNSASTVEPLAPLNQTNKQQVAEARKRATTRHYQRGANVLTLVW